MAAGHVYILMNATMPGFLKIGMTERTPEERARELSQATGVAVAFSVAYSEEVPDCAAAERLIHVRLDQFRTNQDREFFHLPLRDAVRALARIAEEIRQAVPAVAPPSAEQVPPASATRAQSRGERELGGGWYWERIGDHWYQRGRGV